MRCKNASTTCFLDLFRVLSRHALELFAFIIIAKCFARRFDCRQYRRRIIKSLSNAHRPFRSIDPICFSFRKFRRIGEFIFVPFCRQSVEYAVENNTFLCVVDFSDLIRTIFFALRIRHIEYVIRMETFRPFTIVHNQYSVRIDFRTSVAVRCFDLIFYFCRSHNFHTFRSLFDISTIALPFFHAFDDADIRILREKIQKIADRASSVLAKLNKQILILTRRKHLSVLLFRYFIDLRAFFFRVVLYFVLFHIYLLSL